MDIRPIRTEADYKAAMIEVERYFDKIPALGTPEGDRFDVLSTLVQAYENEHDPLPGADPVDMLHFAIEDMGRSQAELGKLLGSRSRASEILNRRRYMTIEQIRLISEAWHLPIATLTSAYELRREYA